MLVWSARSHVRIRVCVRGMLVWSACSHVRVRDIGVECVFACACSRVGCRCGVQDVGVECAFACACSRSRALAWDVGAECVFVSLLTYVFLPILMPLAALTGRKGAYGSGASQLGVKSVQ